jgi:hypothetical protein
VLALENETPYAAERAVLLDADGTKVWVVAVKATYALAPDGGCAPHPDPDPVALAPRYSGAPGASTLLREAELVVAHPGTAVTLNATAYAPAGGQVTERTVGVEVGPVRKRLRVWGDRSWERSWRGLAAGRPAPWREMPLVWERAFGGPSGAGDEEPWPENPIGVGRRAPAGRGGAAEPAPLPNVEYPDHPVRDPAGAPAPAGFAAVPGGWSPRRQLAGTFDAAWRTSRCPLWPADYDPRHHLAAPADQVAAQPLRGGERVRLDGLTPGGGLFEFALPRVHLAFTTYWRRGGRAAHRAQLDRVIVEPTAGRLVLVWRAALPCGGDARAVEATVVSTKRVLW